MKTIVGFLSRSHGYDALKTLVDSPNFKILKVYTHSLNPKSQDPQRNIRDDYNLFVKTCNENNISLVTIDSKNDKIDPPVCDYMVEISWRFLIPDNIVNKAKIACFGIHRGKLPEYAGAEPIKQALTKKENQIVLSAHYLASEIDKGSTIDVEIHPVNYNNDFNLEDNIKRVRDEITPLFSKLMLKVIEKFEQKEKTSFINNHNRNSL